MRRTPARRGQGERHRLAGLVFCRDCGAAMVKVSSRIQGGDAQLSAVRAIRRRPGGNAPPTRCAGTYLEDLVTGRLWELLARWFSPEEVPPYRPDEELEAAVSREAALLKGEIGRRDRALKELYLDKASGLLTTEQFREMSGDYAREKAAMSERAGPAGGDDGPAGTAGACRAGAGGFRGQGGDAGQQQQHCP